MFGADELIAFPGADILFIGVTIALYAVMVYIGRRFSKKV